MFNSIGITFLILIALNFAIDKILTALNLRHLRRSAGTLPPVFHKSVDQETYRKSIAYNADAQKLGIVESIVSLVLVLILVYGGGFKWLDAVARSADPVGYYLPAVVFGMAVFAVSFLADLPFNLYDTFVIEERYGFNTMTPRLFISDLVKNLFLSALIGIPIYLGVLWFMRAAGSLWWLWCWIFLQAVQLLLIIIYPTWIAPLFNTFKPLEPGELKESIKSLAQRTSFPLREVLIMDGSKRSSHSNAYFTGLGKKKRIVLYDTLVNQMTVAQLLAVLAHELGHFTLRHIRKRVILNGILSLVSLYVISRLFGMAEFYNGLGFSHPSNYAALVIFSLCASAFSFLVTPVLSTLSRRLEYHADSFAVNTLMQPEAMKEAIVILSKKNLTNLNPHPWYSFFHYTHPAPVERIQAIEKAIREKASKR
ncbi:MAG TPA: M48 family metallopeptidase [Thermodesulfobacteriota bacterium]|nr:M48 family metallopeptidase [Deltaproteobacteria bacterium]HNU71618.1 M48 family metallopeptidase [Thermodesulfobacteriota bacterium]